MTKTIVTSIIAAVFAAVLTVQMMVPGGTAVVAPASEEEESTYDRVMRTGTIRCGYTPWPPYRGKDLETGELVGIDIDLIKQFESVTNLSFEFVEVALGQNIEDLNSGKIDVMCGAGPWQLSMIVYADFSSPLYYAPIYIYGRHDEERFQTMADLNSELVTFAAIDGDLSHDLKGRLFPKAKIHALSQMAQSSQLVLDVALSKADATIYDPQAAEGFIKNNPNQIKKLFDKPVAVYGLGFAVKKGEKDMLNLLNSAVNIMKDIGVISPILRKYDPEEVFLLEAQDNYK